MPEEQSFVFILAPMQRSGTNFLKDLLMLHENCGQIEDIGEDFILHELHHLENYVDRLLVHWRKHQNPPEHERVRSNLRLKLSAAVEDLVRRELCRNTESVRYIVTKTPSVQNLNLFEDFFPNRRLIFIVRDGRDTVESGMRSFDWPFRNSALAWRNEAERIIEYFESKAMQDICWIRYEDLVGNYKPQIIRILEFLELDVSEYDFDSAEKLPVKGSSESRESKSGRVHWSPIERQDSFNPIARWNSWSRSAQEQFLWWAGPQLCYFGYAKESDLSDVSLKSKIFGALRDLRFSLRIGKSLRKRWNWLAGAWISFIRFFGGSSN